MSMIKTIHFNISPYTKISNTFRHMKTFDYFNIYGSFLVSFLFFFLMRVALQVVKDGTSTQDTHSVYFSWRLPKLHRWINFQYILTIENSQTKCSIFSILNNTKGDTKSLTFEIIPGVIFRILSYCDEFT